MPTSKTEQTECDCRRDITAKLLDRFRAEHPEATGHGVDILNVGVNFKTGGAVYYAPIEYRAAYPLKKGGTKLKTTKGSMVFSHCPFCGVRFDAPKTDPLADGGLTQCDMHEDESF